MKKNLIQLFVLLTVSLIVLSGCVDQSQGDVGSDESNSNKNYERIVVTSVATMGIAEKLDLDLVGIPKSDLSEPPERYKDIKKVGSAMTPDMEIVESLKPDLVLSPDSLKSDLEPKYQESGLDYYFLNLRSVEGMYESIGKLGTILHREKEAESLQDEYEKFIGDYREKNKDKDSPDVLILMGLPGSYVVATEHSYVGSLVKLAGGKNVYGDETEEFVNVNTEDMVQKDPDIILRAVHALPDQVQEMFEKEFRENDIWKNFRAVQNNEVHDLSRGLFGMSANFEYTKALNELEGIFY